MRLIVEENGYDVERFNLFCNYIEPKEDEEHGQLNQNLNIIVKDSKVFEILNLDSIEDILNIGMGIEISNDNVLNLTGFTFETFDGYINENGEERFDLRFHKYEK